MRIVSIALAVIGCFAIVLGLAGYVDVSLHLAGIQCPDDERCVDRTMGHVIYGDVGFAGLVVAIVGGLLAWRSEAAVRRRMSWSR
jgi:hypothetical protein